MLILFAGGASAFASVASYRSVVGPYMGWIHLPGIGALVAAHYYYWTHPQVPGLTPRKIVFWASTVFSVAMIGYFYVWGMLLYPY
ncbi:MAG: hypothetical protein HY278_07255 [candidate division NC10 bacterium]|nr:hypothetical protein [candidate division NC10 bacterium]